jgi:hypothetical protein
VRETIDRFFERLANVQIARPAIPMALVALLSALGAWLALHLELRTRFDQLLPESQPSVVALREAQARTPYAQTAMIVLEGDDLVIRKFGDAIVPRLRALGPSVVTSADDGVQTARSFFMPRAALFLTTAELAKLSQVADDRWNWEVARASGTALDDTEPPPVDKDEIQKLFESKPGASEVDRFPDGYFARPGALVVLARSPVPLGDLDDVKRAVDRMHGEVDEAAREDPAFSRVRVTWTGDMIAGLDEYAAVRDDLLHVGGTGLALVLSVVVLYFMRFRALVVMTATIACGLACTFGLTDLVIGHLNVATGFLFSIVAGNGINVGILYLSRYYEEKRNGASTAEAVRVAHRTTWPSTAVAAIASAAAYSSLAATHFRTFRQFAFIGASGMTTCWLVTVTLLPALLVALDARPMAPAGAGVFARVRRGVPYGALFAKIVPRAPTAILVASAAVGIAGIVCAARYAARNPMEYDLTKIQNDRMSGGERRRAWDVATSILGKFNDAMVVLADDPEDAREAQAVLRDRWAKAPANRKPFDAVRSIFDFVPDDQVEKLPVVLGLADRVRSAREHRFVTDADWARTEPLLPPPDLKPWGLGDLPADVARPFTERSGARGTIVLVEPSATENTNDLHYLLRYAASFRDVPLRNGKVLHGAGRALVFADILDAVVTQVPRALGISLALTIAAVLATLRRSHAASVLAALAVGFSGVALFLYYAHIRLNFLNFIALPITFGIGVDYSVNVMQRYAADGSRDILATLRTTGGAVVLCSLTTMLGYFALLGSHNQAIRSLGEVAVAGEASCLLAAVLALPAWWYRRT